MIAAKAAINSITLAQPTDIRNDAAFVDRCCFPHRRRGGLARYQLNDRDDPSSLPGLLTEVGVLRVDAVSKIPQSLALSFVFHDFGSERQAAENDVGCLRRL